MKQYQILVHAPNWIGDMVQSYPFFRALRVSFPGAKITVFARPQVASLIYQAQVDSQEVYTSLSSLVFKRSWKWWKEFHAPSLTFNLTRSEGVQILFWALGAKKVRQVGSHPDSSRKDAYLALLPEPRMLHPLPGAFPVETEWGLGVSTPDVTSFEAEMAIAPGSQAESRRVPWDVFEYLIQAVWGKTRKPTLILGGPRERSLGQYLESRLGKAVKNMVSTGTPAQLAPILRRVRLLVASDSGLAHLGALLGCKTLVLWGAGNPQQTRPSDPAVLFLPKESPPLCWPCVKNTCAHKSEGAIPCLEGFRSEESRQALLDAVGAYLSGAHIV